MKANQHETAQTHSGVDTGTSPFEVHFLDRRRYSRERASQSFYEIGGAPNRSSTRHERSMLESRVWNSGDDEEAINKLLMSYKGEIMMAIDSVDSVDLSETDRELMFKHISTIIKQDRIRVRPQNQKAV